MQRRLLRICSSSTAPRGGWGAHTRLIVAWHRRRQHEGGRRQARERDTKTKKEGQRVRGKNDSMYECVFICDEQKCSCGVLPTLQADPTSYPAPHHHLHSRFSTYPLFYTAQELHFSPFKSRASTYLEASPEGDATISTREGLNMLLYSAINNPILCSAFSLDILCQSCFHFRSSQSCIFGLIWAQSTDRMSATEKICVRIEERKQWWTHLTTLRFGFSQVRLSLIERGAHIGAISPSSTGSFSHTGASQAG